MCELSDKIMDRLEQFRLFQAASCIALYHAIPGEVQTAGFIEKWYQKKKKLKKRVTEEDKEELRRLAEGLYGNDEDQVSDEEVAELRKSMEELGGDL